MRASQPWRFRRMNSYARVPEPSPLVSVGSSYIVKEVGNVSAAVLAKLEDVMAAFLRYEIDAVRACQFFMATIGTSKPIERLSMILSVSERPLPSISNLPLEAQSFLLRKKSRAWSDYEDLRLLAGIHRFGLDGWGSVAQFVGNSRTKAQCCQRWCRGLDPKISKIQWTKEEDHKLLDLVAQYGQKAWTKIAAEFGNRCDVQCRYRYKQLSSTTRTEDDDRETGPITLEKVKLPPIQTLFAAGPMAVGSHEELCVAHLF